MSRNYFEAIIEGHPEFIKGFVCGLITGRGVPGGIFFGEDFELDDDSPMEMLTRLVGIRQDHTVIIVAASVMELLHEVFAVEEKAMGMKLISTREIREASFRFSFVTFSREVGGKLDLVLRQIPPDVSIEPPYAPEVKVDAEGEGVEAYAPLHEYELKAQGKISGDCEGVCHCYERLHRYEVVELTPLVLNYK